MAKLAKRLDDTKADKTEDANAGEKPVAAVMSSPLINTIPPAAVFLTVTVPLTVARAPTSRCRRMS